jgi:hypothetical protein
MDQALEQVAESVAQELESSFGGPLGVDSDRPADVLQEAVQRSIRALVRDRKVAEVFLRNRRDQTSALGARWTLLTDTLRRRMQEFAVQVRGDIAPQDAALYAELLVGVVFSLAEANLDGRVEDTDRAAAVACRAIVSSIAAASSVADAA